MIRPIILDFWSFGTLFVFCHVGEIVCSRFEEIDKAIYQSEWYTFSSKTRKIFPIIMHKAQQPVIICGFGNLQLSHDSFKRVSSVFWFNFQFS